MLTSRASTDIKLPTNTHINKYRTHHFVPILEKSSITMGLHSITEVFNRGVRFVAIAKTKSRERKVEGREPCSHTRRQQTYPLGNQIGKLC